MSYYFRLGQIPHKRHTQFRQPDGSLYHEELMGLRGFSGPKSLLYHLRPPTRVSKIAGSCPVELPYADQGPLRHRLLHTEALPAQGDAVQGSLRHLGFAAEAAAVEAAVADAIEAGECTADAGGSLSTREAAVAVARRLG